MGKYAVKWEVYHNRLTTCHWCIYTGGTMKTVHDSFLTIRINKDTLVAFRKKAAKEPNHDASSVLRQLINDYLKGLKNVH